MNTSMDNPNRASRLWRSRSCRVLILAHCLYS